MALLRFDLAYFARGLADVSAIEALLNTATDAEWRGELLARRLCMHSALHGPAAALETVPVPLKQGHSAMPSSVHAVVGELPRLAPAPWNRPCASLDPAPVPVERPGRDGAAGAPSPTAPSPSSGWAASRRRMHSSTAPATTSTVAAASPEGAVVAAVLGALRLEQGRVQSAFLQAASATGTFIDLGLTVPARRCYTMCATALALAGHAAKAAETLVELDALALPTDLSYEVEVLQARAWVWAAGGDMARHASTSRRRRRSGAKSATCSAPPRPSTGWPGWDGPARWSTSSANSPNGWTASSTTARLAYVLGAARRDSRGLDEAAAQFETIGANLYAAEALGESAVHLRRAGMTREAAASQQRAARLLGALRGRRHARSCAPSGPGPSSRRPSSTPRCRRPPGSTRQADRRAHAPLRAHGREPAPPRLPEARASPTVVSSAEALRDLPEP